MTTSDPNESTRYPTPPPHMQMHPLPHATAQPLAPRTVVPSRPIRSERTVWSDLFPLLIPRSAWPLVCHRIFRERDLASPRVRGSLPEAPNPPHLLPSAPCVARTRPAWLRLNTPRRPTSSDSLSQTHTRPPGPSHPPCPRTHHTVYTRFCASESVCKGTAIRSTIAGSASDAAAHGCSAEVV